MYGSSLTSETLILRDSRMAASEAAAIPLPREETTPPVTKTYLVMCDPSAGKREFYSKASLARRSIAPIEAGEMLDPGIGVVGKAAALSSISSRPDGRSGRHVCATITRYTRRMKVGE